MAQAVTTASQTEIAEREKQIQLIEARKTAEQQAIAVTVAADADKKAAADRAEAVRVAAEAAAQKEKIAAEAAAEAEKFRAEGLSAVYSAEATGKRAVNEASNTLSVEQVAMQVRLALIQALPQIIAQSVKPLENIDGIKILHVEGLNGGGHAAQRRRRQRRSRRPGGIGGAALPQPGAADRCADEGTRAAGRRSQRDDRGRAADAATKPKPQG